MTNGAIIDFTCRKNSIEHDKWWVMKSELSVLLADLLLSSVVKTPDCTTLFILLDNLNSHVEVVSFNCGTERFIVSSFPYVS